jgi:hypothetical protein
MSTEDDVIGGYNFRHSKTYKLLLNNLPKYKQTRFTFNVKTLANDLGISDKAIYIWFNKDKIPSTQFSKLLELENSTLTAEQLVSQS